MKRYVVIAVFAFFLHAGSSGYCAPKVFRVVDPLGRNMVTFESRAPMETILGTTNRIHGVLQVDPENLKAPAKVAMEVELAGLSTGIPLRDEDMRRKYLETELYPTVRFNLERIEESSMDRLASGEAVEIRAVGTLDLHGVTRQEPVLMRVTYLEEDEKTRARLPGNLLRIEGTFELLLSDYEIPVPKLVVARLNNRIHVKVDVFATDAPDRALKAGKPGVQGR